MEGSRENKRRVWKERGLESYNDNVSVVLTSLRRSKQEMALAKTAKRTRSTTSACSEHWCKMMMATPLSSKKLAADQGFSRNNILVSGSLDVRFSWWDEPRDIAKHYWCYSLLLIYIISTDSRTFTILHVYRIDTYVLASHRLTWTGFAVFRLRNGQFRIYVPANGLEDHLKSVLREVRLLLCIYLFNNATDMDSQDFRFHGTNIAPEYRITKDTTIESSLNSSSMSTQGFESYLNEKSYKFWRLTTQLELKSNPKWPKFPRRSNRPCATIHLSKRVKIWPCTDHFG